MFENLETYRESYNPLAEQETENLNHERKAKSLFSRSLTKNYGKGIAFFSSCKNKICSTVKKIGDDVTNAISKKPVKNLEEAQKNTYLSETMNYETDSLLYKISRKNFETTVSDYQEKAEKSNYFDYHERLAISESEERKRRESLVTNKEPKKKSEKIKIQIGISEIKESALDLCPTQRQLYIVQNDEEKNEDSILDTSIPTIEINKNVKISKRSSMKKNKKIETSFKIQQVKKKIEKQETEMEKNQNLTNEKTIQTSFNNIEFQNDMEEQEESEIVKHQKQKIDQKVDKSTQSIDINQNLEDIEKKENISLKMVKKNETLIQSIEIKNNIEIIDKEVVTENNPSLKINREIERFIQDLEANQTVENLEKRKSEIENNQNLKKDKNFDIFLQKPEELKVDIDNKEIELEKIEILKKEKNFEVPQSSVGDLNLASTEKETKEAVFQLCTSEPKQSIVNFNHYIVQKFPFDFSQNNPVEIIKKEKNSIQKKKNKNRFLSWCCS